MKTKRVGTISMAIVLIGFGILLLIAQFSQISAVELAIKFWPLVLIILGSEVLWFTYINKEGDNFLIRYDIFSMFIVLVILMVNIGLYGLMETGILDYIKLRVSEETLIYERTLDELNNE
ncbi:MAG TPA: DUF5668 domain-containing protein [Tissierellaceae bacterium]|nr:DUF5668 domain-containing protein [Tissierellaceae bacterium]